MTDNSFLGTEQAPNAVPTDDERVLAILCHVLAFFFWIFPPLVIYLLKKDESSFVSDHAKEALNFQITLTIVCILMAITIIGLVFIWIPLTVELILVIVAAIKASDKKIYRYPLTIRLVK